MRKLKLVSIMLLGWLCLTSCGETSVASLSSSLTTSSSYSTISDESSETSSSNISTASEVTSEVSSSLEETSSETTSIDYSVQSVSFINTPETINIGENYQLNWIVYPSFAKDKNVTFTSSDSDILTVSKLGVVSALKQGRATITITTNDNQKTDTCLLEVIVPLAQRLQFTNERSEVYLDQTLQLTWEFTPAIVLDNRVNFTVISPEILSVDDDGLITPTSEGSSQIIISNISKTVSDQIVITVLPSIVSHISSLLTRSEEKEKNDLLSGQCQTKFTNNYESNVEKENFQIAKDNQIITKTEFTALDQHQNIVDYLEYYRYQGYLHNDAYYEIADYGNFENEEYSNILNRYSIPREINESEAIRRSNLFKPGESEIYGVGAQLLDIISSIPSYFTFTSSFDDSSYTIDASYQDEDNELTKYSLEMSFDENDYLLSATIQTGIYDIDVLDDSQTLNSSNNVTFNLTYGSRNLSGGLNIDPNDYYFSSFDFYLAYDRDGQSPVETTSVTNNSYIYCVLNEFSPLGASEYDFLRFTASSDNAVIYINTPVERLYCRQAGSTILTISSQRGITKEIEITVTA